MANGAPRVDWHRAVLAVVVAVALLSACSADGAAPTEVVEETTAVEPGPPDATVGGSPEKAGGGGRVTLALAGDVHFEGALATMPARRGSTLGPISRTLRDADVAVVNLESALTDRDSPTAKEKEDPASRYWFRSPTSALGVLERSGVDVVSMANNHGADHGVRGLRESLRADRRSDVAIVGIGRTPAAAYDAHTVDVRGTRVSVFAADGSPRESADPVWSVAPGSGPGLATARLPNVRPLLTAVSAADAAGDVVVVYLHWGREYDGCPTRSQRRLAQLLSDAGADVIVGTHAHLLLGAGMLGDTYVSYGLGHLQWYHGFRPESGVLRLTLEPDGEVVGERWVPGLTPPDGGATVPLTGDARTAAVADWRRLRGCTGLEAGPGPLEAPDPAPPEPEPAPGDPAPLPAYVADVRRLPGALRTRMTGSTHDPATCPVSLDDLRLLQVTHVDFEGRARTGRIVVNADVADDVVEVFGELYRAGFPIERMQLVDAFGGDDDRSMAANNTSGYNCRTVAGQSTFSQHAYGRAVDINPVQNPYVVGGEVRPPAGRRWVTQRGGPGVIGTNGLVVATFDRLGWTWGGRFSEPDFQHFDLR